MDVSWQDIARALDLEPHPEGGFFRETYRARERVATARGPRAVATAILFLSTADSPSRWHRLAGAELWFYHGGRPLELFTLAPGGSAGRVVLAGTDALLEGVEFSPQALVAAGTWQAARVLTGGEQSVGPSPENSWTLVSCLVTPGFEFADFELADAAELTGAYPDQAELIAELC